MTTKISKNQKGRRERSSSSEPQPQPPKKRAAAAATTEEITTTNNKSNNNKSIGGEKTPSFQPTATKMSPSTVGSASYSSCPDDNPEASKKNGKKMAAHAAAALKMRNEKMRVWPRRRCSEEETRVARKKRNRIY